MTIEIKASNGITITLNDASSLIDLMSDEDRMQVIESLSCYDNVIKHVVDQISSMYGMTENGFAGGQICGYERLYGEGTVLDKARYQVACSAQESNSELINQQSDAIKRLEERLSKTQDELLKFRYPERYPSNSQID
ncbi:TPA: hypothetical protein ACHW2M_004629 [Yersinia enterocolitica]|uniref:Uncharacterized protein n=3 Tax=Yersinia enterocolitica TaxID=630 RepID=A0A0T7P733_YEREN|nr:hypothetical protein [Yersinia enterocolitica]UNA05511.1 hypothetical protein vBYenM2918_021 [Yersinia phage vB_YenM_29.18]UNA05789.1 hypothetical protein vBYenM21017_021 [Yersinia phage vB_YenM_210.17]EKN3690893.1 hypothetical protein [Yersinia enterocolitica]EKN3828359.1 hypothetical protein [Yersinia enterocolitica]EKN4826783.1 hypothetical protein [Yersinia enterocolitica]